MVSRGIGIGMEFPGPQAVGPVVMSIRLSTKLLQCDVRYYPLGGVEG